MFQGERDIYGLNTTYALVSIQCTGGQLLYALAALENIGTHVMNPTPQQQSLSSDSLVWRMVGRATKWGVAGGANLGLVYGVLVIVVRGIAENVMAPEGALAGTVPSLPTILFFAVFGGLFGCVIGGFMGLVLGVINGWLLGLITRRFFCPLTNIRRYRWIVGLTSTSISLIAAAIGFASVRPERQLEINVVTVTLHVAVPTLIAGLAAGWASQVLATWYARVTREAQQGYEIK